MRLYEAAVASDGRIVAKVRRRFRLDGANRKVVSITYNLLVLILWPGLGTLDTNGSPKLLRREDLRTMRLESTGWFLDPEFMIKAHYMGLRVLEVNVFARMRGTGLSHVRASTCWEFLVELLRYRFTGVLRRWRRETHDSRHHRGPRRDGGHTKNPPLHHRIEHCRACGSDQLGEVLDLGMQPLANALPCRSVGVRRRAALPIGTMRLRPCGLLQLVDVISPEVLFAHYLYVTGTSETIAAHNVRYAATVVNTLGLGPESPGRRGREQRRKPDRVLPSRMACAYGALNRRKTSRGSLRPAGIPTDVVFFRSNGRRAARARTWSGAGRDRQQRPGTRQRSRRLPRRCRDLDSGNGACDRGSAVPRRDARSAGVRHHLPRAPLLLLRHRTARAGGTRRTACRPGRPGPGARRVDPDVVCAGPVPLPGTRPRCSHSRRRNVKGGIADPDALASFRGGGDPTIALVLRDLLESAAQRGRDGRWLWCSGEGEHPPQLLRDRDRPA